MLSSLYFNRVMDIAQRAAHQTEALTGARDLICRSFREGGMLHVFGTGHSHMMALELFYRAGGTARVNPILDDGLMLHAGAVKSTSMERLGGYAQILFAHHGVSAGDVMIICSNSGINAVPVEMAQCCQEAGVGVIALTNEAQSRGADSRHGSGKKLYELADVVIDNCCEPGDAAVVMPGSDIRIGPASSVIGCLLLNMLMVDVAEDCFKNQIELESFVSSNIPGGEQRNEAVLRKYGPIIKSL